MFEITCPESVIEREVATRTLHRADVAQTYALAILSSGPVDWRRINTAILSRWTPSGLEWIRKAAWALVRKAQEEATP